ncbi:MAG: carbohydrate porin [Pseudomonadota bacterium]|nr:carbohydrate porin [Pseudomonadota bacterium]
MAIRRLAALACALLPAPAALADRVLGRHFLGLDGYIRTGVGSSEAGERQADFQAPGAQAKYRLGNEANTYYELAVDYRYRFADPEADDTPYFQTYFMTADSQPFGSDEELGLDITQQLYVNLVGVVPGISLWFGRRYYDRKDIHLNDHFWLNTGQGAEFGGGVEGINVGDARLKVAAFRLEDDQPGPTLNSASIDLRLSDIQVSDKGFLTLWGLWVRRDGDAGLPDRDGFGIGFWHDQADLLELVGTNTFSVTLRRGAAVPQGTGNPNPVREDQGFDLGDALAWEVTNNLLIEPNQRFSMQWGVVLRSEDRGRRGVKGDTIRWYSTGVRPIYYFSDHLNLALEMGLDHVDNEILGVEGQLAKTTLALQIARDRGYFSRPVLRLFGTYAAWSDDFRDLVGNSPDGAPYGDDTSGWTFGTQFESWW